MTKGRRGPTTSHPPCRFAAVARLFTRLSPQARPWPGAFRARHIYFVSAERKTKEQPARRRSTHIMPALLVESHGSISEIKHEREPRACARVASAGARKRGNKLDLYQLLSAIDHTPRPDLARSLSQHLDRSASSCAAPRPRDHLSSSRARSDNTLPAPARTKHSAKSMRSPSEPAQKPHLVWDWDIEHADRQAERKADAAVHGAIPFEVDRKLLKDIVKERMGADVARIKYLGAGTFAKTSSRASAERHARSVIGTFHKVNIPAQTLHNLAVSRPVLPAHVAVTSSQMPSGTPHNLRNHHSRRERFRSPLRASPMASSECCHARQSAPILGAYRSSLARMDVAYFLGSRRGAVRRRAT
ncbi:hypothetical protein BC628DRAFT_193238 [Trametes gibbosa]|nr:hypothetical protein BC628DRAFT_193238 [Trametes gibbosa]